MEESKQQQILLQMQHQQRQQQLFMMQHLQKQKQQQQQQAAMSMFPSSVDGHLRPPPGVIQTRPVNPSPQNVSFNLSPDPNSIPHTNNVQQQQQKTMMMMMMQQQQQEQRSMMQKQQQQQQEQKSILPLNQLELQFAYQDAWSVCHPDFKRPFDSLEDACERLLPYHVVADYEAEEDDRLIDSDTTSKTLSRSQQWDNNIATKAGEFIATFEKQAQAFNIIAQKKKDGELRSEERLMIEQILLLEERNACIEVKAELDREMMKAAQEARMRMVALAQAGQVKAESQQQCHGDNAIGNHGEQGLNMNPDEMMMMMMMMNGYGNHNNKNNGQREEKEPLESFLNDEENEKLGANGEFDLNIL